MSDEIQGKDNTVEKPIILRQQELVNGLTMQINSSGLPAYIVEPLLHNLWLQANASMQNEYESNLQYYQSMCENKNVDNDKNHDDS